MPAGGGGGVAGEADKPGFPLLRRLERLNQCGVILMFQFRVRTLLIVMSLWAILLGLASTLGAVGCVGFFLVLTICARSIASQAIRRSAILTSSGCVAISWGVWFPELSLHREGLTIGAISLYGVLATMFGLIFLVFSLADYREPEPEKGAPSENE